MNLNETTFPIFKLKLNKDLVDRVPQTWLQCIFNDICGYVRPYSKSHKELVFIDLNRNIFILGVGKNISKRKKNTIVKFLLQTDIATIETDNDNPFPEFPDPPLYYNYNGVALYIRNDGKQ